ncbi:NADH dehydrogenase [ubiquinone] 1 subunit C2-like [Asterias amurensis]|uniref:NADH dehydrogenase [ubiquinone] 1 subunit C2-like n=1 Tax=Asterias amurensis TaxID=7602 RepID=UPI003AB19DF3
MSQTGRKLDASVLNKYTYLFGFYGFAASAIQNALLRRPVLSGVHRHLLFTLVGAGIGTFAGVVEKERYGKRDFYIDDYIKRNPDDFVKGPPKKMSEEFELWVPINK